MLADHNRCSTISCILAWQMWQPSNNRKNNQIYICRLILKWHTQKYQSTAHSLIFNACIFDDTFQLLLLLQKLLQGGADKSLAPPRRKKATEIKLRIYSTCSPQSSIHFLARCSNVCKPLKKKKWEGFPSKQVSAAAITSASDKKWRPFNFFFTPANRW